MYICFICPFTGLIHIWFCILIPISFPKENYICIGICTLCKTEQPLQEMKLQEREEENKGKWIGKMIRKKPSIKYPC